MSHAPAYSVAGVLVHVAESDSAAAATDIAQLPGATVHACAGTKLVVTLEGTDPAAILERLTRIQRLPGVMSAALISEHSEPLDTIDEELNDE
jgi:nitrate reductase NapD